MMWDHRVSDEVTVRSRQPAQKAQIKIVWFPGSIFYQDAVTSGRGVFPAWCWSPILLSEVPEDVCLLLERRCSLLFQV